MYTYSWDSETGGYKITSSHLSFSKEPRPVYYKELDILGFHKYWDYNKNDSYPYLWSESNCYYYRGRLVAKTKGGSLYTAPELTLMEEPEPNGEKLRFVDIPAMIAKNENIMESLVQETIKNIYNTYMEYKDKIDVFYVAFSGGKDSIVMLDVVQRALPHNAFKVVFGDTGMEFPDTYDVVENVKDWCKINNIEFLTATSHLTPEETWKEFGPPSQTMRWCCSVHKTTPQILKLREITGKHDFTGMAFIGVRGDESISRSEYDYVSLGKKHKGQYNCNPILEWNSAEIYMYIYQNNLILNDAYKKGNSRAGCLVCPMAAYKNEYFKSQSYPSETQKFFNVISETNGKDLTDEKTVKQYLENGGWKARKNGRELATRVEKYTEKSEKGSTRITLVSPSTDWREWIKTIGVLLDDTSPFHVLYRGNVYEFSLEENNIGYVVTISEEITKKNPTFSKYFKNIFHKSAYCVGCKECMADCHNGCLRIENGQVKVSNDCKHCSECHKVDKGCLLYKSVVLPKGGLLMNSKFKSLNCYSNHGPKIEWMEQYFEFKNDFNTKHTLGSNMFDFFKRFLRDANLLDKNGFTSTAQIIDGIGLSKPVSWGIMLVNLVYTPQFGWFIKNIYRHETYSRDLLINMLQEDDVKPQAAGQMWLAFRRILDLPFNEVGLGHCNIEKNKVVSITRDIWQNPNSKVVLYGLYKFAETCGDYYQFTLSRLLNHDIDSDGISPTEIFGLDREIMVKLLNGLSVNYPEFISASFTLDLDNIDLRSDKTAADVLKLF